MTARGNQLDCMLVIKDAYASHPHIGLMGTYNGDISDDFTVTPGETPLSINSSATVIHEQFGEACKYCIFCRYKLSAQRTNLTLCLFLPENHSGLIPLDLSVQKTYLIWYLSLPREPIRLDSSLCPENKSDCIPPQPYLIPLTIQRTNLIWYPSLTREPIRFDTSLFPQDQSDLITLSTQRTILIWYVSPPREHIWFDGSSCPDLLSACWDPFPLTVNRVSIDPYLYLWRFGLLVVSPSVRITPAESLFWYETADEAVLFQDPSFVPIVEPLVWSSQQEQQAAEDLCLGDTACLYDFFVTKDTDFASVTRGINVENTYTTDDVSELLLVCWISKPFCSMYILCA